MHKVKKLTKIGTSHGVILDKTILELLKIDINSKIEITTDGRSIILRPIRK